ncbi:MAG: hypothetical protein JWO38_2242 [Gemmataceae bacterium]|nr:hypothetical protein [Gemmataceae bacterium]
MKRLLPSVAVAVVVLAGCTPPPTPPEPAEPIPAPAPVPKTPEPAKASPIVPESSPMPVAPPPEPRPEPDPTPVPVPVRAAKGQPLRPAAPPLPAPVGDVVAVDTVAKLHDAVARARAGTTILLADGRYALSKPLHIRADRVSLRGKSGDRTKVVLDGGGTLGEAIWLSTCSDVTVADLTVRDVRWNGIKLNSESGVQRVRIYNCEFRNIWQRAVKAVAVPEANRERLRPRDCRIEYCLFANDRPKKFGDDPDDTPGSFGGDYIAGIDLMFATGWVIRDNVFRGINGRTGQGRGAVFLWRDSRDCVVERNVIVDCDAGISLGNALHDPKTPPHCTGCVVRNNCVTRAPEGGITSLHTKDCKILHNTVCDTTGKIRRGVRVELAADGLVVANNLLAGPKVGINTGSRVEERSNREGVAASAFVDAAGGDLHLAERIDGVADAGQVLPDAPRDLDGRRRGGRADLGAHEFSPE